MASGWRARVQDQYYGHPDIVQSIPPDPDEDDFPLPVSPFMRFTWFIESQIRSAAPRPELAALIDDYTRRSIIDLMFRTQRVPWDGAVPLRDLFDLATLGGTVSGTKDSAPLIDQRFIDYLHAQPQDLSQIHWRQFEFLVGE